MLIFWPLALLLFTGTFANYESGRYEMLLYYRIREYMVDAVGEAKNTVAPLCLSPCDFETFIKKVTLTIKGQPLIGPNGKPLRDSKGNRLFSPNPDYSKADFTPLKTLDLSKYGDVERALDKLGFIGHFIDDAIFGVKGAGYTVFLESLDKAVEASRTELQKQGKDFNGGLLKEIQDLFKISADARRIDYAKGMIKAFGKDFPGVNVIQTPDISRSSPPLATYQQIAIENTIKANPSLSANDKAKMRSYVKDYHSRKASLSHLKAISTLDKLHDTINYPPGQCPT
ncbi:hypothetical protein THARTR1_06051 [Trichoderma harzianum]|uniref:Uncharacterized protein n=1 Tax=Trichoderma harzianum TaxID=5544 RepID=A0A2K0U6F7_TRIHA|nr:hypothetical protein THARTR1_06051 [Trichoderma harzianum]